MSVKYYTVEETAAGQRLDRWFRQIFPGTSHVFLEKLLRSGQIRVDGARVKASHRLLVGQRVRVPPFRVLDNKKRRSAKVTVNQDVLRSLKQRVLYSDSNVLVINKPQGLAVQGGSKVSSHLDAMLDSLCFDKSERPRLVHRLDKDTAGVLVLARTSASAIDLSAIFRTRQVRKLYWALVIGRPPKSEGQISIPLAKGPVDRGGERMVASGAGREAISLYRVIEEGEGLTWLALMPLTGRTHQLRAHCAYIDTPIVGDRKYGKKTPPGGSSDLGSGLHLLARSIDIPGIWGSPIRVVAPLPEHMMSSFGALSFSAKNVDPDDFDQLARLL